MNKKNSLTIILILMIITVVRFIGIERVPFVLIVIILIACIIGMFLSAFKFQGDKKERMHLLIMTLLISLLLGIISVSVIIENSYPQISKQYNSIFIVLIASLFLILLIVIFMNVIHKFNKNK